MDLGLFKKLFIYFCAEDKKNIILYMLLSYVASILEVLGVAMVYPLMILLLKPELQDKLPFVISPLYLGIGIFFVFILKNIYMCYCYKIQARFSKRLETRLLQRFMDYFLEASYLDTLKISRVVKERLMSVLVTETVNNFFLRYLNLNINLAIVVSILGLLCIKFPIPALITFCFAVIVLCLQNVVYKNVLKKLAEINWQSQVEFDILKGAIFPNIKLIKLANKTAEFRAFFSNSINNLQKSQTNYMTMNSIQPYVLEPLVIILLFIMLGVIAFDYQKDTTVMVASFAIVASAIFRILPALSRVQVSVNGISVGREFAKELITFYEANIKNYKPIFPVVSEEFNEKISIKNLSFSYSKEKDVLSNINFEIKKNSFVGIVGISGSGKSTFVDVLTGLLPVTNGEIYVDSKKVSGISNLVGYVPQEPIFFNTSIRENIAFGAKEIDDERVIKVLKQVGLYEFIRDTYDNGIYATALVDTHGLSQGQKQRLSIARALYSNPKILILDEVTSALDLKSEDEICSLFAELSSKITIISIAHRLYTLKNADNIIFLKNGKLFAQGSFNFLQENCNEFQALLMVEKNRLTNQR